MPPAGVGARRGDVMREFDQNVARIVERQNLAGLDRADEVGRDMHVGPGRQVQFDVLTIELCLQSGDSVANLRPVVVVNAGHDVGRTGLDRDTVGDGGARHGERHVEACRAVVNAWQYMGMQVDQVAPSGHKSISLE